jgi:hypothetical protein
MTRPEASLFAHLVCEPIVLPGDAQAIYNTVVLASAPSAVSSVVSDEAPPVPPKASATSPRHTMPTSFLPLLPSPILERSSSRCGTPTFGSRMLLPRDDELQGLKSGGAGAAKKWLKAKGLGVRSVVAHKAEKQKGKAELPSSAKGSSPRDEAHNVTHASPSHTRVWWKKSLPNSTSSSSIALNELDVPIPEQPHVGRGRRGTITLNDVPSTPLQDPRVHTSSSVKWPTSHSSLNAETAAVAAPEASTHRSRRPSVASITRKLSFATFNRRPSATDLTGPLPTPPHSATFPDLAPPPSLYSDNGRRLKHLPSSPALRRNDVDKSVQRPAVPRRPSLSFADQASPKSTVQTVRKSHLMHGAEISSPPSGILLKALGTSPSTSQQGSPNIGLLDSPRSPSPGISSSQTPSASIPPGHVPVSPKVKRASNTPRLPRRLSIPLLRRKQSIAVLQDEGGEPDERI